MRVGIARFTYDGVSDAAITQHPFPSGDGLGLALTRFHRADCDDVVLLLHGLPASTDMFIMPEHRNLVSVLLDEGFTDVWSLDFRMSNRFPYDTETHRYTLDDIAVHDHPAALRELRRHIGGRRRIHVVAQCLGSVSFMMSLAAGLSADVASVTSNSVALVTRVPEWSKWKLALGPNFFDYVVGVSFLDSRFGDAPIGTRGWLISRAVSLFHPECDDHACHMISFMWGAGRPGLWSHQNLAPETHARVADLFGANGLHYYRHMRRMVGAGHAVPYDRKYPQLPRDYLAEAGKITTPVLFLTGDRNHVFTDSNIVCHDVMSEAQPGLHELAVLPGYGHVDPIIGKNAHRDVFPRIVDFLRRHSDGSADGAR
ncbi:alpha/beta fold hydrolase [Streptosporangiaceae bacterium NEAU-GS5]|nr:alpha/beta fold hydrolase [Streptosporangiaceae bacterium NEAU-GS5]